MSLEFIYEYGLFLAKVITFVAALVVIIVTVVASSHKPKAKKGELEVTDLSSQMKQDKEDFITATLDKQELKAHKKALKEQCKAKQEKANSKVFVIHFNGSMDAHEVEGLREEVSAIINIADSQKDEVVMILESGGGVVHGYGLAASQVQRIKNADIPLTICVDKVAASGGYMMACLADKLICAPFAIIGSIGVIAQIPNFNKILKKLDVDFEQITAGEYKRTLTLFGENTEKAKDKFKEEVEQTHHLFKQYVAKARPNLVLEQVATGEHWFGYDALEKGLVDELNTSDDVLIDFHQQEKQLFSVKYKIKKGLGDKLGISLSKVTETVLMRILSKSNELFK